MKKTTDNLLKETESWKEGYKVVRVKNKKLVSFITGYFYSEKTEHYACHKTCPPTRYSTTKIAIQREKYGPLTVFENKEAALEFLRIFKEVHLTYRIYKCRYQPSTEEILYVPIKKTDKRHEGTMFPEHTALATAVLLTERIKEK